MAVAPGMVRARRWLFPAVLAAGTGLAVAIMAALVAVQVAEVGVAAPLRILAAPDILGAIRLSLLCATLASGLAMLLAVPTAYALARHPFPGRALVDTLLDIPIVLSPVAVGMTLLLLFRTRPGAWVEERLLRFVFEVPGIVLAQFVMALALQVRVLKAAFEEVPERLEQVARFLGCGPWQTIRRVTLPLARPGLLAAFVLGWGRAVGEYGATVTIAGSVRGKTETIPTAIVQNWSALRLEAALALVLLLTGLALAVILLVRCLQRRRSPRP
jgi:molybdate transport system permease protein